MIQFTSTRDVAYVSQGLDLIMVKFAHMHDRKSHEIASQLKRQLHAQSDMSGFGLDYIYVRSANENVAVMVVTALGYIMLEFQLTCLSTTANDDMKRIARKNMLEVDNLLARIQEALTASMIAAQIMGSN